jgi:hypothetical protein
MQRSVLLAMRSIVKRSIVKNGALLIRGLFA